MLSGQKQISPKELEEKVLAFWESAGIYKKSIRQRSKAPAFSFFDGPPFLSGTPHHGHILATTIKDAVTRFWTMFGYRVERRLGWDCHGLPIENLIEKELKIKNKRGIEEMGIENFNHACRSAGLASLDSFEKTLKRVGRWADYEKNYFTWDNDYMESVWWVFKTLWENGLIYKDFRVSPYCPRCGTPLSNFEVSQGYKDVSDASAYIKFKIKDAKNEYFLAWTTTPWTLPGNVALAVGPSIDYVKIKTAKEILILAKERLPVIDEKYEIIENLKGKKIAGKAYEPLFPLNIENEKIYTVLEGDFVSTEDGTGIVHIAPAFGEDDNKIIKSKNPELAKKLEQLNTVKDDGTIKEGVIAQGLFVKDADKVIIEDLAKRGLLFKTAEIIHSYPFCWRCESPLLYYPVESWYVAVTKFREQLVKNNKQIHWVPEHIKEGRFGNWLKDARDWAISRNRFWGAVLPVWQCQSCKEYHAIGSLKELSDKIPSNGNRFYMMRHGEAYTNTLGVNSCYPEKNNFSLTKKGETQVKKAASILKRKKIDFIFASDILRTGQTAEIVSKNIGVPVHYDKRLREYNVGEFNGQPYEKFNEFIGPEENKFKLTPKKGENANDIRARMMEFVIEADKKYKNKNILIIGHGDPFWILEGAAQGWSDSRIISSRKKYIKTAEVRPLNLMRLPFDKEGKLDMHRPAIDDIKIKCSKCKVEASRIPQVFDCWFESGSMPYAQWHYPFENKKLTEKTFPADFIAEGIDQTRGWFYTLHVIAGGLTFKKGPFGLNKPAFKNVVVNGLILDEYGRKLSKKLKNYTEPFEVFEKIGADAMRFFLLSSTPIGEDYRVSDKAIEEVKRKVIDRFINSYNFYELYSNGVSQKSFQPLHPLDKWILSRLNQTIAVMTKNMQAHELTGATRPLILFLDDLSNWYIRRSRRRLQKPDNAKDFESAKQTLGFVLAETSKLMAPFSPFVSEAVYKSLAAKNPKIYKESVHLDNWPKSDPKKIDSALNSGMETVRLLASVALAKRAQAGIKVRQPLQSLMVKSKPMPKDLIEILKDEINVKEIVFDIKAKKEAILDTVITPELYEEGVLRDLVRVIQTLRQEAGYKPKDEIELYFESPDLANFVEKNAAFIKKEAAVKIISMKRSEKADAKSETVIDGKSLWIAVRKP